MESKLQRFLIPFLAIISLIYAIQALGNQSSILLSEIYHQQCEQECSLEVGNFYFCFTQKPKIDLLKISQKDNYEERTFFFPQVTLKEKKLQGIIEKLNKEYTHYKVDVSIVNKPVIGIQMILRYDRNKIDFSYEECESMNLQNGVIFRLYNKGVIKKLRLQKSKPVLMVASLPGALIC